MLPDHATSPQPLTFRAGLLQRVAARLRAGECCSIIGPSGVGKTNLGRFLQRQDVQALYFPDAPTWIVLIDCNALAAADASREFAVFELIAHRLIREAERRNLPESVIAPLDRLHITLLNEGNLLLALRYLERICGRLIEDQGLRLILLFDQFEDIWRALDAGLFRNLRYLRDEFKYRLIYLTITRERLSRARQRARGDADDVEAFWELFEPHTFGLGMHTESEAREILERIARRRGVAPTAEMARAVLDASGGYPALIRALAWTLDEQWPGEAPERIAALPEVAQECAKLWNDLLPDEQRVVRHLAAGLDMSDADQEVLADLRLIELVRSEPPQLFAPVFAAYVRNQGGASSEGIVVDRRQRRVWVDGRLLPGPLPPLEFSLLTYLAERAGTVCPREEILSALYPEERLEANDERIDTLLKRLRDSIGDDGRNPRHLITHRGVGVRLARGRLEEG
ncbi:MAG: winged helix-turn-helix domain-containing protein [Oscillochloridaceae bacterium]|nr:winged helix-turn-helix domain-containing protein [Chloroflexaceae bacterium]MDW8391299.1 winged helix-turn-helix domain-containing protein [Oscillochloridaceae bacterium]